MSSMSLRDALKRKLEASFPSALLFGAGPTEPIVTFSAKNVFVGPVTVWDNEADAMIVVGEITHLHIEPNDGEPATLVWEERVADAVVEWLAALFADDILLWRSPAIRGAGGHQRFAADAEFSLMGPNDETFRWSGPVPNPLAPAI